MNEIYDEVYLLEQNEPMISATKSRFPIGIWGMGGVVFSSCFPITRRKGLNYDCANGH